MIRSRAIRSAVAAVTLSVNVLVCPRPGVGQESAYEELQNFSALLNLIRLNYVDEFAYAELTRAAMQGLLQQLDPHSYLLTRNDQSQLENLGSGKIAGVGIHVEQWREDVVVLSVNRYGPADDADVRPGDRIVAVNDTSIAGLGARELDVRLLGDPGSKVDLRLERGPRANPNVFEVRLKREHQPEGSVTMVAMLEPGVGYVLLERFNKGAADELREAVAGLVGRGANLLLLDLRGNPGGHLDEARLAASMFLWEERLLFTTRGRKAEMNREYRVPSSGPFRSVPLVVIIDESSASASEALAVSLQDNDRALVVGRRSFGKALIQSPLLLPQGDVVWLTVGRVYAPSGRLIQRDYEEVTAGEYMASAGEAPEMDTLIYRTATGRIVRGGGGVRPDVEISRPVRLPHYWTESLNAGLPLEVATAAAPSIPATVEVWLSESDIWASELLEPYLDRVQSRLQTGGEITTAEADRIARELADLAAGVRWGRAGQERFRLMTDPDIARALEAHRQHTRDYQNSGTGDLQ